MIYKEHLFPKLYLVSKQMFAEYIKKQVTEL